MRQASNLRNRVETSKTNGKDEQSILAVALMQLAKHLNSVTLGGSADGAATSQGHQYPEAEMDPKYVPNVWMCQNRACQEKGILSAPGAETCGQFVPGGCGATRVDCEGVRLPPQARCWIRTLPESVSMKSRSRSSLVVMRSLS